MKFKILFLFFVLILLVGSVYAFSEDNIINNLVNNLGLNKPFLKDKEKTIVNEENIRDLITTKASLEGAGACLALNGVCINFDEECGVDYWEDPSLSNSCSENQKCCTPNIIRLDSMAPVGRVYVYSGISLVARIDPE